MKLSLVGCSHHNAPVDLRERLAFSPAQAGEALQRFRQRFPEIEAVLLSTCNRVEVYTAPRGGDSLDQKAVATFLADFHGLDPYAVFDRLFEQSDEEALRHLFTVAASLDSMVVGEPQILAQVKQAYQLAQEHESAGPVTHEVFQAALRVAKRVAGETAINEKRVSIPSVAVADFGRQIFERFDDKNILVIGAGEMGEETLRYLQNEGATQVTVVNRTFARAREAAERFRGRALSWDHLDQCLIDADLIVSTTGAEERVVSLDRFGRIERARQQRPLFILDLAAPRDFDPEIGQRKGVFLYSLDDLQAACERNRQERQKELPAAMAIVEQETSRFMAEWRRRTTGPVIQRLRQGWQDVRHEELERLFARLPEIDEAAKHEIALAFERYANKLLHPPLESLRDESRNGPPHGLLEALKRLFQLKD